MAIQDTHFITSWEAVQAIMAAPLPTYYHADRKAASHFNAPSTDWDYYAGWGGTLALAGSNGWPDGSKKVKKLADSFISSVGSKMILPEFSPAVTGEFFDVASVLSGEPECWLERSESEQEITGAGKIYSLVADMCCSSTVDASALELRGAALIAIAQLLELAGHQTEITAFVDGIRYGCDGLRVRITVKHAGQPFDIDRLALLLAHPAGFRRIGFRLLEEFATDKQRDDIGIRSGGGYGSVCATTPEGDVFSPSMVNAGPFAHIGTTEQWIESELKKLGVM